MSCMIPNQIVQAARRMMGILPHELIVDNFAGGGGASTGIEQALGRPVDIAINHDPEAIALHRINHPYTEHHCESVWDVDPVALVRGRPVALVWLSPDCKHFSKAKGGKPVEKRVRGLAWITLRWAVLTNPRVITLENVEEFKTWCPLITDALGRQYPDPTRSGETFKAFVAMLGKEGIAADHPAYAEACEFLQIDQDSDTGQRLQKGLGYHLEHRELRANMVNTPTIRKRFFMVARRDGLPIRWPERTHAPKNDSAVINGNLLPELTGADCIDWSLPCPSIFDRNKPLADATCRRIAAGIMNYVINNPDPFILYPDHGVLAPVLTECANASSPRCMPIDEPLRTICANVKGGHHALISAFLAKYTDSENQPANDPVYIPIDKNTIHLVTSNLVTLRNNCIGQAIDKPLPTITASGGHLAEVRAFLVAYYGAEKDGQALNEPFRTIPTNDRFGLVIIHGQPYQIVDIGFRMLQPHELYKGQGFPVTYIISHGMDEHGNKIKLSKKAQNKMCGNSVCPPLARALIEANFSDEIEWDDAA